MGDEHDGPRTSGGGAPDPIAVSLAIAGGASREEADTFLKKQSRLVDLQIEDLKREDKLRHWSLRVRHISDVMKLAFELAVAFIVLAIAFGIGAALWSAAHDDSLVIEAFSVPPDMAARGLTGQAVAAQLQDKLVVMQDATKSARPPESYASNWGNDIKVEIPNTGISISELYRYLAGWLGHETHITGDVFRTPNGISVIARAGGNGASTASGAEGDLDKLLQQAAEKIYMRTQPYRYAIFIRSLDLSRIAEARRVLEGLTSSGSMRERAWAWNGLAPLDILDDKIEHAIVDYHQALALWPGFALPYINLDSNEGLLGHDQASLDAARSAVRLLQGGGDVGMSEGARTISLPGTQSDVAFGQNDFNAARTYEERALLLPDYGNEVENARDTIIEADALLHDAEAVKRGLAALPAASDAPTISQRAVIAFLADYWFGRWARVLAATQQVEALAFRSFVSQGGKPSSAAQIISLQIWPYEATAMAMTGNIAGARALIAKTPLDCYACVRNRGRIAQATRNWDEADRWYALATREAPSIPIGYSEWGQMLLHRGNVDGAIAKFEEAHTKGPHFADPLEMWGEALIAKNRSDLALAKFEDANRYAPNWGRLHLKWGEALAYTGRRTDAAAQYRSASVLDLGAAEKAELTRDTRP